jgi:hypothetical protein
MPRLPTAIANAIKRIPSVLRTAGTYSIRIPVMERALRLAVGLVIGAVGALLGLYGLFALLYRDHSGGSTYVTLFGHERDAHLVGAVSLVVAAILITAAVLLGRLRQRG